eukprot:scaffold441_cov241-Pinguiococcus_pyrenoidosus.AAC.6
MRSPAWSGAALSPSWSVSATPLASRISSPSPIVRPRGPSTCTETSYSQLSDAPDRKRRRTNRNSKATRILSSWASPTSHGRLSRIPSLPLASCSNTRVAFGNEVGPEKGSGGCWPMWYVTPARLSGARNAFLSPATRLLHTLETFTALFPERRFGFSGNLLSEPQHSFTP